MFKGLAGLKKVVKGGISAVAEQTSDLAEKVYSDPNTSQGHLKESLKKKVAEVVGGNEHVSTESAAREKADEVAKVVHKVKHYGAFGEEYLGFDDPNKDIRKAVKAKEKAAKKARKDKKKKTGKKEIDLFDPENLAKFKAELEERKRREAEFAAAQGSPESEKQPSPSSAKDPEFNFQLDLEVPEKAKQDLLASSPTTPSRNKEDTEDWKLFQSLTSGVDSVIKKKKEELEDIKLDSYFQRKPVENPEPPAVKQHHKRKGKKWVDLDQGGFDDFDGSVSVSSKSSEDGEVAEDHQEQNLEEVKATENELGLVDIPSDDENLSEEEDLFNTDFVNAVTSGDVKLAVIPDDPIYDDEDDPFNTSYADEIVRRDKQEKHKEATRLKFSGLSAVADVLSGKADKVDKSLVEQSTKKKRRRANRINLIGEDLTAREDIACVDLNVDPADQPDILGQFSEGDLIAAPDCGADLLSSTPSPCPPITVTNVDSAILDLSEFEVLDKEKEKSLTSNVAILAGEFSKPLEEVEDDFDAAFDALAHESVTRSKLDELERQFEDADVFDTSCAETILNLASLTNQVIIVEEPLETFEDKDPFDTSAYEDITGELETDLDFDSLAKRDPEFEEKKLDTVAAWDKVQPIVDQGWAAFQEPKPSRPPKPPPPRPAPPRPAEPRRAPKVYLDPASGRHTPSVVVKAPSTESIKSWNCSTADILIKKSEIQALEDEEGLEGANEDDPFDTSNFEGIVPEPEDPFDVSGFKSPERANTPEIEEPEDPFDLSGFKSPEREEAPDLLANLEDDVDLGEVTLAPVATEADPFDTGFASGVLPDKGDPFDTSYVKGAPGKAEIKALEEEFLDQGEFDPRTEAGEESASRKVLPGSAGRARPKKGPRLPLEVKAPDLDVDPFDTTIVDKILPVRKATKSSTISVEDDDFDPTSTFLSTKEEVDPFDTSIAGKVIPELVESEVEVSEDIPEETTIEPEPEPEPPKAATPPPPPPKKVDEIAKKIGRARPRKPLARQLTDEDFDPRS